VYTHVQAFYPSEALSLVLHVCTDSCVSTTRVEHEVRRYRDVHAEVYAVPYSLLEQWTIGTMDYWNNGLLEQWTIGKTA